MLVSRALLPDVKELIHRKDWKGLKEVLDEWFPADVADLLERLDAKDAVVMFRLLNKKMAAQVFAELDAHRQESLLRAFANQEIQALLRGLAPDDRTALFDDLPGELTQKLLNLLAADDRKETLQLLGYPEDSVGRLMTPDYVAIRPHWSIGQAMRHIRDRGRDTETINMIYVTDENWKLVDAIPIRRFVLAVEGEHVADIMDRRYVAISAQEDQEQAYRVMKRYNLSVLPVTDPDGTLLGIVTIDDMLDVQEEEVSEDFHKVAAVVPVSETYALASPWLLYKKRVGWLMFLLVSGFLSSNIIAHYEKALQTAVALAFFIPVLIDSGGNTASQSSTLIIRAIATGELNLDKWFQVIKKELLVGGLLGLTLGALLFLRGYVWQGGLQMGFIVGLAMVAIILWSNLLGSVLPIVLTRFHLDPAVISSPLLTTVVDAGGLMIYFALAQLILGSVNL